MESPSPVSPKSFPVPKQRAGTEQQQQKKNNNNNNNNNNNDNNNNNEGGKTMVKKMPIAIVPGWQVTWSDWFASRVEIKDAYSPMDHWQWGATLWRNMVGADVTVAVQAAAAAQDTSSSSAAAAASLVSPDKASLKTGGGSEAKGGHEKGRNGGSGGGSAVGGVEVKLEDARAVIVRGERDGGVAEGGLRRVGFEIGEWVRGWEEKEERARRGS